MLDGLAHLIDDPIDPFKALAAYLVEAYGADRARIMAGSWAQALSGIIAAGGDISRITGNAHHLPNADDHRAYDPFCPPNMVREMADAIPRGEFLVAPGGGHDVHQSHSAWLVSTVVDWLSDH